MSLLLNRPSSTSYMHCSPVPCKVAGAALLVWLMSCNPPEPPTGPVVSAPPGMVKIASSGKTFDQGLNDGSASIDEKPGMKSSFTYDYWLDTAEVTQKDFADRMGRNPVPDTSVTGRGDRFPVYHVSWFDAVLYCNARSRGESLDTVYTYSSVQALHNGIVHSIIGLNFDFSRNGYRLPTEAEWEYAARSGTPVSASADSADAENTGWYSENSGGTTHQVASRPANKSGIYDMAGNVFEWTNDWKGFYNGEDIVNSLGSPKPNSAFEKVIKGGAFNHGRVYLRPSYRSATYTTAMSASSEYVGFRCARGALSGGHFIGALPLDFTPNPVTVEIAAEAMRYFAGATAEKLVFVNVTGPNRTLCVVDFSVAFPFVREFTDDPGVCRPVISPDGRYVAYSSGNIGLEGESVITVRSIDSLSSQRSRLADDSAFLPVWWIDPKSGDTCLVYTSSAVVNGGASWKTTKTFVQKMHGTTPNGAPEEFIAGGSFHDGVSIDGRFALTSSDRLVMRNIATGEEKQLFTHPHNGKAAGGSAQACNASIAPDTSGDARCLFLDFGSSAPSTITGQSYGIHGYLLVTSFADSVTSYVRVPENEELWDFPRWSNKMNLAVSSSRNAGGQAHAIYSVNIPTREVRLLCSGTELHQPCLWTGAQDYNPDSLDLDSLGRYAEPYLTDAQNNLGEQLHYFWKYHDQFDIVFVGTSYVYSGIDCSKLSGYRAMSFSSAGCGLDAVAAIVDNYILPHASKIRLIGFNVPFDNFAEPGGQLNSFSWNAAFRVIKGFRYDADHQFFTRNTSPNFYRTISSRPFPDGGTDSLGFTGNPATGWGGPNPDLSGDTTWTVDDTLYRQNLATFTGIIDRCIAHDVKVVAINFPESPQYRKTSHFLRYGPSWETGRKVLEELRSLEKSHPGFYLYDAYNFGDHDYSEIDATNWNHLSVNGASKLTGRLATFVHDKLDTSP